VGCFQMGVKLIYAAFWISTGFKEDPLPGGFGSWLCHHADNFTYLLSLFNKISFILSFAENFFGNTKINFFDRNQCALCSAVCGSGSGIRYGKKNGIPDPGLIWCPDKTSRISNTSKNVSITIFTVTGSGFRTAKKSRTLTSCTHSV
jgi:hypothetical protein